MIPKKLFTPDRICDDIYSVTPEYLKSLGTSLLVSDIDNTLVTYDDEMPTPSVLEWLAKTEASGIKIAFLSNNDEARVGKFNSKLGYAARAKAKKPSKKFLAELAMHHGVGCNEVCVIGDQIFTDVLCASLYGAKSILVSPIKDKTDIFTRFKRVLEKPFISRYKKRQFYK